MKTFEQRRKKLASFVWSKKFAKLPGKKQRRLKRRLRFVAKKVRERGRG